MHCVACRALLAAFTATTCPWVFFAQAISQLGAVVRMLVVLVLFAASRPCTTQAWRRPVTGARVCCLLVSTIRSYMKCTCSVLAHCPVLYNTVYHAQSVALSGVRGCSWYIWQRMLVLQQVGTGRGIARVWVQPAVRWEQCVLPVMSKQATAPTDGLQQLVLVDCLACCSVHLPWSRCEVCIVWWSGCCEDVQALTATNGIWRSCQRVC